MKKKEPNLFIVYAKNGGYNGWAIIRANTKKEVRTNAYNEWLEDAKITHIETWDEYSKNLSTKDKNVVLNKLGEKQWHELEWGS